MIVLPEPLFPVKVNVEVPILIVPVELNGFPFVPEIVTREAVRVRVAPDCTSSVPIGSATLVPVLNMPFEITKLFVTEKLVAIVFVPVPDEVRL